LSSQSAARRRDTLFRCVLEKINEAGIPYLVGGGHSVEMYLGVVRNTKDLDLFARRRDVDLILKVFAENGYKTDLCFSHWLGKIWSGHDFVDVIFSSGNGICAVDDAWFEHAIEGELLEVPIRFCPPEETIWTKAFVMERERYDGADVAHLFRACGARLDWKRLLRRFETHWQVLLSHLVLFDFIYPSERYLIPSWLMKELLNRLDDQKGQPLSKNLVCRGTLLSRKQYRQDIENWGYQDARQLPAGPMTPDQARLWTAASEDKP
jgi:hypothetical protein